MSAYSKDPAERLDYVFDWSLWLADDTISSSVMTVDAGLTKVSDTNSTTTATVWLSGGTLGRTYEIVNRIVTAGGRIGERTITITIADK